MIKLVFCLRRLPHLSREEFQRYWLESHGPLVRQLAPALGVKRYVQVHTVTSAFSEALSRHRGAPDNSKLADGHSGPIVQRIGALDR